MENFLSVLAVVETGPSLLEFFRVSGGGRSPGSPPGAATGMRQCLSYAHSTLK